MRKLNNSEIQLISGGGFWRGFCSGFTLGAAGLLVIGISTGPLGAAAYTSVGVGCAIHTVVEQVSNKMNLQH